jgi:hypothetical protein
LKHFANKIERRKQADDEKRLLPTTFCLHYGLDCCWPDSCSALVCPPPYFCLVLVTAAFVLDEFCRGHRRIGVDHFVCSRNLATPCGQSLMTPTGTCGTCRGPSHSTKVLDQSWSLCGPSREINGHFESEYLLSPD